MCQYPSAPLLHVLYKSLQMHLANNLLSFQMSLKPHLIQSRHTVTWTLPDSKSSFRCRMAVTNYDKWNMHSNTSPKIPKLLKSLISALYDSHFCVEWILFPKAQQNTKKYVIEIASISFWIIWFLQFISAKLHLYYFSNRAIHYDVLSGSVTNVIWIFYVVCILVFI